MLSIFVSVFCLQDVPLISGGTDVKRPAICSSVTIVMYSRRFIPPTPNASEITLRGSTQGPLSEPVFAPNPRVASIYTPEEHSMTSTTSTHDGSRRMKARSANVDHASRASYRESSETLLDSVESSITDTIIEEELVADDTTTASPRYGEHPNYHPYHN